MRSGYAVIDYMSAYLAAFGVMVALYHRDVHAAGGQILDLALYEAGFRASEDSLVRHAVDGVVRERSGNLNDRIVPATDLLAGDGRTVSVHAGTDGLFRKLCGVMGRPELADDPRYRSRQDRVTHQDSLYALIRDWAAQLSAAELTTRCSAAGVPASPVMTIADIAQDPHYLERQSIITVQDEEFGALPMPAPFPRLVGSPGQVRSTGPSLGSANKEIYLGLLELSDDELADLISEGVV